MTAVADRIRAYLAAHHVLTLATQGPEGPWAAPLFYAAADLTLYFVSSPGSRHGRNLGAGGRAAAAIAEPYRDWQEIQGVQLEGVAAPLSGAERAAALAVYLARFPFAAAFLDPAGPLYPAAGQKVSLYRLQPQRLALTDNRVAFGHRDWLEVTPPPPR